MGRRSKQLQTRRKAKLAKESRPEKDVKRAASDSSKHSADKLLDQAENCIDQFNYELAQKFCQRALQAEPKNVRALEVTGAVLLELDNMDGAKQCFEQAIQLQPDEGHSKYMYMGQLATDKEAAEYFLKGIEIMKKCLETESQMQAEGGEEANQACAKPSRGKSVTVREISSAHCSVAEIYMTDACFEEDAETQCKKNLDEAMAIDSSNPEAYHLMASYYLSLDDAKAAEESMDKGINLWLPQLKEAEKPSNKEEIDPVEVCTVGFPARVNAVKILIELQKYEVATEILELLLDEDDSVVEVWYLLGWANYLQGDDCKNNARYYLQKAQKVAAQTHCEDQDLVGHIDEILTELGPGDQENSDAEDEVAEGDEMEIDSSGDEDEETTTQDTNNMEL